MNIQRKDARVVVVEILVPNEAVAQNVVAHFQEDWDCWGGVRTPDGIVETPHANVWHESPSDDQWETWALMSAIGL